MSGPLQPPKISDGYLGKQAKFEEYGLEVVSHPEPTIELDTNQVEIHIGFDKPIRFTTKLMLCGTGGKDLPEFVMVNNLQGRMCYTITVPVVGYYKFQIYALPLGEAGPNMVGVFNYLICVKEVDHEIRPFPKQYPPWKNGCYMWEPRGIPKGCRAPGVPFKMHIPNAVQVMVRAGDEWTELDRVEEHLFQKLVDFSKPDMENGGKVHVNVKCKGQAQFVTYLEYMV